MKIIYLIMRVYPSGKEEVENGYSEIEIVKSVIGNLAASNSNVGYKIQQINLIEKEDIEKKSGELTINWEKTSEDREDAS